MGFAYHSMPNERAAWVFGAQFRRSAFLTDMRKEKC